VKENHIFLIFETFKCRKKTMSKTAPFKTTENPWSNALGNALGTHWETHWERIGKRIGKLIGKRIVKPV
jgi:hypothetical protein